VGNSTPFLKRRKKMRVKATALGYYDHKRRRPGEVFELMPYEKTVNQHTGQKEVVTAEAQFSKRWMEKFEGKRHVSRQEMRKQKVANVSKAVHEPDENEFEDDDSASNQDVL
jgi:hypothetical protein